jgi:hypothetical protein
VTGAGDEPEHAPEYTARDFASEILRLYDRGEWSDPVNMIGHLAAAIRMLLEVTGSPLPAPASACHYCGRAGQPMQPCCGRHPDDLVCTDAKACLAYIVATTPDPDGTR